MILGQDLAELYRVPTKRLNEAVGLKADRFPADCAFQLNPQENETLRSQFATSNAGRGGRRTAPWAFTEHGALMAATILNSPEPIQMSVHGVRAFVRFRAALGAHPQLAARLAQLE